MPLDTSIGSSFLPKQPMAERLEVRRSVGVLFPLAIIIFFGSLGAYGAAFLYKDDIATRRESVEETIRRTEERFDAPLLLELREMNDRLAVSRELLASHVSLIPALNFLSEETIRGMRYTTFSFGSKAPGSENSLELSGIAVDYDAIALQSEIFARNRGDVLEFLFEDLSLERDGTVRFSLSIKLNPKLFLYSEKVRSAQGTTQTQTP